MSTENTTNVNTEQTAEEKKIAEKRVLEYLIFQTGSQCPEIYDIVKDTYNSCVECEAPNEIIVNLFKIMCTSKGLVEYRVNEMSELLNITKNRMKTIIKNLEEKGKIKKVVAYEKTFIKICQAEQAAS